MTVRQNHYATFNELETENMPLLNEYMIDPDLRGDDFFHESSISDEMLIPTDAELTDTSSLVPASERDVALPLSPTQDTLVGLSCDNGSEKLPNPQSDRWRDSIVVMRGEGGGIWTPRRNMADIVARNEKYYAEAVMEEFEATSLWPSHLNSQRLICTLLEGWLYREPKQENRSVESYFERKLQSLGRLRVKQAWYSQLYVV